jgi:hypothetical protein
VHMYPNVEVLDIVDATIGARMTARAIETETIISADYDCVFLCTGFDDESVFESSIVGLELLKSFHNCERLFSTAVRRSSNAFRDVPAGLVSVFNISGGTPPISTAFATRSVP